MNEITELQKKRAVNSIWNAARNYSFYPDFKAYDEAGNADLYWNCIIGAMRRHYDYSKIAPVFAAFAHEEEADTFEGLLWLGLENCVYQREVRDRPVLKDLRIAYAKRYVETYSGSVPDDYHLLECLSYAHYLRILGKEPKISRYDRQLLDELEFSPELSTDEIVEKAGQLFQKWFQITTDEKKLERRKLEFTFRFGRKTTQYRKQIRKFGVGLLDHPKDKSGYGREEDTEKQEIKTSLTQAQLREFMAGKFGRASLSAQQIQETERQLCVGNHVNCHLHLTRGERTDAVIRNGFEALQREKEAAQIAKNRQYFQNNLARGRAGIQKLAGTIQNSVLLYLHPTPVRSDSGLLEGGRVWRATRLDDNRIFVRNEQGSMGDLSVDILLDASTSQKNRQETVSNQGYMIAEALTKCAIPCRVMSFCSMTGFTIMRIFRDYNEPQNNAKIFEYVSNGCNRDGLAIRMAHHLINRAPYEHRLLIILSDVKPNDVVRIPGKEDGTRVEYEKEAGVRDTAYEVRRARADGICVICVFTGSDEDVPSAKLVYGHDFARIQSLDNLADTVSMLIQNQLRNL